MDLEAEVAALKTEVRYLKWIIPSACGFVAILILVFWNIERNRVGDRVREALDKAGADTAIEEIKKAHSEVLDYAKEIKRLKVHHPLASIPILSVDHQSNRKGQFFNFDISNIDNIVGNQEWGNKRFVIMHGSTSEIATAILWRHSNGGSIGDGHGRWLSEADKNQWKQGDNFIIVYAPE
ncbi:MAG: hypothetical protein JAY74_08555 [Candidatus Thiodiazotropha taylori]|nr:hypothetical protein [Candidatus Thiodiazotropha taylori]